jgi:hypothetical protein
MEPKQFDPSRYLTKIGPADYLEVKWRLVWLRTDHPDADLQTQVVHYDDDHALFKATISIPGRGSATGYGSETRADFREFMEKAETKAVGRALAALGFGTQFCADYEFSEGSNKVVDSPVDFASTRGRQLAAGSSNGHAPAPNGDGISDKQIGFVRKLGTELGLSQDQLAKHIEQLYSKPIAELTKAEASELIERMKTKAAGASAH